MQCIVCKCIQARWKTRRACGNKQLVSISVAPHRRKLSGIGAVFVMIRREKRRFASSSPCKRQCQERSPCMTSVYSNQRPCISRVRSLANCCSVSMPGGHPGQESLSVRWTSVQRAATYEMYENKKNACEILWIYGRFTRPCPSIDLFPSLEPGPSRARYFPGDMLLLTTTARERWISLQRAAFCLTCQHVLWRGGSWICLNHCGSTSMFNTSRELP